MPAFRTLATAVLVGLALLAAALPAAAQLTESRITGRATDSSAAVLPGVTVTVTSTQTGAVRTAVTESDGAYTVTNLGPGTYKVLFALDGFASSEVSETLGVGDTKAANAALAIASVNQHQALVIRDSHLIKPIVMRQFILRQAPLACTAPSGSCAR